jgi:hypothetical protein
MGIAAGCYCLPNGSMALPPEGANMRVIEKSPYRDEFGQISLESRLRGTLAYGFRWYAEMQAQGSITQRLERTFDKDTILLRNITVPGLALPIPMVLINLQGVRVLVPVTIKGVYRAREDDWLVFDGGARRFKRARPNLQKQALSMSEALMHQLRSHGFELPEIEAVLIFTHPTTHVDTVKPKTRIVLAHAIDHFAAKVLEFPPIMDQEDTREILKAIETPVVQAPEDDEMLAAQPAPEPELPGSRGAALDADLLQPMERRASFLAGLRSIRLSGAQWIVLGILLFFELLIIAFMAFLILVNNPL